ncbi:SCP-like extracellular [Rhodomicrobium vannielii ATCC 17100]|uniref:SCP-like extracellular n=1 Tax=Rhodomicrobium vannielii (strain ATCC 17100 / DSM 162 / LMG 4299 / NCIMB 10020 / ATH 3.1.1) TaxID=648757 RepID=E3I8J5_RHOVT|nr:CAP domain-containing protein [Rhodomicrobium vannielii]ADP70904.1 SCP-like extracellular [Rhodomicrobium vannielii ATCC 17100]
MWRTLGLFVFFASLGGCAATGALPSMSGFGGGLSDTEPPKTAMAAEPVAASTASSSGSSSGISGIWSNFSSAFSSGDAAAASKSPIGEQPDVLDPNEALRLVNDYRASQGLPSLSLEPHATEAAYILAKNMAKTDKMSHVGPGGADVGKRLTLAGYRYRVAAENIGAGQASVAQIIDGWKHSPPHSRNLLLADAKHMGIAFEYKPDTKFKRFWALVVAAP